MLSTVVPNDRWITASAATGEHWVNRSLRSGRGSAIVCSAQRRSCCSARISEQGKELTWRRRVRRTRRVRRVRRSKAQAASHGGSRRAALAVRRAAAGATPRLNPVRITPAAPALPAGTPQPGAAILDGGTVPEPMPRTRPTPLCQSCRLRGPRTRQVQESSDDVDGLHRGRGGRGGRSRPGRRGVLAADPRRHRGRRIPGDRSTRTNRASHGCSSSHSAPANQEVRRTQLHFGQVCSLTSRHHPRRDLGNPTDTMAAVASGNDV